MAQYDLFRMDDSLLVMDLQSDLLPFQQTRIVAPLRVRGTVAELSKLNPLLEFGETLYIIRLQQLASVNGALLRAPVGNGAQMRDEITRALDLLFHGV